MLKQICLALAGCASAILADGPGVIVSHRAPADFPLTADPEAASWKGITGIFMENGPKGEPAPGHRTEVRSRWTNDNIYFLYICPYQELHLHPNPTQTAETNKLWDWDVAEVFIGTNFKNIRLYKEFEMSPQGEWVDLDIDSGNMGNANAWLWNSGFEVKARIDEAKKIWYGEMRIPTKSVDDRPPAAGLEMRINLYRCQGTDPHRKYIAWQPTHTATFHTPEAFGRMRLAD
ncbi:MAG TPA: carbohydrate-binding family 9-like protein [Bryobacteraceae bacterium]|nr:carbohydrate-binding family 9-like protein [Bryobacteraceae bacterium]